MRLKPLVLAIFLLIPSIAAFSSNYETSSKVVKTSVNSEGFTPKISVRPMEPKNHKHATLRVSQTQSGSTPLIYYFVYATDIHYGSAGIDITYYYKFRDQVQGVYAKAAVKPLAVILSGDLIDEPSTTLYPFWDQVKQDLNLTDYGVRLIVAPGNHDFNDGSTYVYDAYLRWKQTFGDPLNKIDIYVNSTHYVRIITLNTTKAGSTSGTITVTQLDALQTWISEADSDPNCLSIYVVGHHPVGPNSDTENITRGNFGDYLLSIFNDITSGDPWRLVRILANSRKVVAYICGHTHINTVKYLRGVWSITTAPLCRSGPWTVNYDGRGYCYRLLVRDNGVFSCPYFEAGQWPVAVITNVQHGDVLSGVEEIRALVFYPPSTVINEVKLYIDDIGFVADFEPVNVNECGGLYRAYLNVSNLPDWQLRMRVYVRYNDTEEYWTFGKYFFARVSGGLQASRGDLGMISFGFFDDCPLMFLYVYSRNYSNAAMPFAMVSYPVGTSTNYDYIRLKSLVVCWNRYWSFYNFIRFYMAGASGFITPDDEAYYLNVMHKLLAGIYLYDSYDSSTSTLYQKVRSWKQDGSDFGVATSFADYSFYERYWLQVTLQSSSFKSEVWKLMDSSYYYYYNDAYASADYDYDDIRYAVCIARGLHDTEKDVTWMTHIGLIYFEVDLGGNIMKFNMVPNIIGVRTKLEIIKAMFNSTTATVYVNLTNYDTGEAIPNQPVILEGSQDGIHWIELNEAMTDSSGIAVFYVQPYRYYRAKLKIDYDPLYFIDVFETPLAPSVSEVWKDLYPPRFQNYTHIPSVPDMGERIEVRAYVYESSSESGIASVVLRYNDSEGIHEVLMTFSGEYYYAEIGPFYDEMIISYEIIATDYVGNSDFINGTIEIVDQTPPTISSVMYKDSPPYNESATIAVYAYDAYREDEPQYGVESVVIIYSVNGGANSSLYTSFNGTRWIATIPAQSYGSKVTFFVRAYDIRGNVIEAGPYSYVVSDPYPPELEPITAPTKAECGTQIEIAVNASEPEGASGVSEVFLIVEVNGQNETYSMLLNAESGLWKAVIGPFHYRDSVRYWILARDHAGNENILGPINLGITDSNPPEIVLLSPETFNYNETVILVASVSEGDYESGICNVTFIVTVNNETFTLTPMFNGTHYYCYLGKYKYEMVIRFVATAVDNAGNSASTEMVIEIVDEYSPSIVKFALESEPLSGCELRFYAVVSEPENASGLSKVKIYYYVNDVLYFDEMTFNGTCWVYVIEPQEYGTSITAFIVAYDNAGNEAISEKLSFIVGDGNPPRISLISISPEKPVYRAETIVVVKVVDEESGIANVSFLVLADGVEIDIEVNASGDLYYIKIPRLSYGTEVSVYVNATDREGNSRQALVACFTISDDVPPSILNISYEKEVTNGTGILRVFAVVEEPENASGVKEVYLIYRKLGGEWIRVNMTYNEKWFCEIELPVGTTIEFRIVAVDNEGNVAYSQSYTVSFESGSQETQPPKEEHAVFEEKENTFMRLLLIAVTVAILLAVAIIRRRS